MATVPNDDSQTTMYAWGNPNLVLYPAHAAQIDHMAYRG